MLMMSIKYQNFMFKIFNKNASLKKMHKKHEQLLKKAYHLSKSNRMLSDQKYAEAEEVLNKIKEAEKK